MKELKLKGLTCREIASQIKVNLSTVSRYLKE
nr:winged helix-turn-helix transcriptional regulator [Clostridium estertheticum]